MSRRYVFADEAGDFAFSREGNASRYFVLCTITLDSCQVGHDLLELRRDLAWRKAALGNYFHATTDQQNIRDEVFNLIGRHDFTVQATIMEKSKAQPQAKVSKDRFYKYGWYYHFKHAGQRIIRKATELLLTTASLGTKKGQHAFTSAVNDVVQQTIRRRQWATSFCPCAADPCLQVADYCTWAIQRKWERSDDRSYRLIQDRINYEFDLWRRGSTHYY